MPGSNDEYLIHPAGAHDAKVIALQRASMFRDMGSVSADESELLRRASEPWLSGQLTNGDYIVAGGAQRNRRRWRRDFCAGVRACSGLLSGGSMGAHCESPYKTLPSAARFGAPAHEKNTGLVHGAPD